VSNKDAASYNNRLPASLIERIERTPYSEAPATSIVVPFYDHSVYLKLAYETAMSVGRHGGDDLLMVVDAYTATQLHALSELRDVAKQTIVLGAGLSGWSPSENVLHLSNWDRLEARDHVLLLLSSAVSVVILGSAVAAEHDDETPFTGGWTVQRDYVTHAAEALVGREARALLDGIDGPEDGSAQMSAIAMRLMALHANALAHRQHDIAMDKNDLFSVLNILKAISAKRRAHDILFVFVEQIARVIPSDRCSVVRVWGSERRGRVLASHEDASISDYHIDLTKYPELMKALATREKVVVNDVHSDALTAPISDVLRKANVNAVLVLPIVLFDQNIGSLLLRAARSKFGFSLREISFFEIVSEAASNALERAHLFESIQIANENLERLAITDGLTGIFNHRHFRERFDQELERALRYRLPLSCMLFDIDRFKDFNDSFGHLVGDEILREIADRTRACIRKSDVCARYGGEEFVVIMPQTGLEGALAQAERIREVIGKKPFACVPENKPVTVSVGVGVLDFDRMLVCEDLLREADQAMYRAKRAGRNRVEGPERKEGA